MDKYDTKFLNYALEFDTIAHNYDEIKKYAVIIVKNSNSEAV